VDFWNINLFEREKNKSLIKDGKKISEEKRFLSELFFG